MATKSRPSAVAVTPRCQHQSVSKPGPLTERNRAGNLAREIHFIRRPRVGHQRRDKERIHTQCLHLEHLVRLLHIFPRLDRFLQLELPLQPCLGGLGVQGAQTSRSAVVVNCARVYGSRVVGGIGTHACTRRIYVLIWVVRFFFTTE